MARRRSKPERLAPAGGWQNHGKTVPPEASSAPTGKRIPVLDVDNDDVLRRRPVWRFADLDDDGPWPLRTCSPDDLPDVLDKLKSFESMTIGEIFRPGSDHGKTYAVPDLPRPALARLQEIERDDETELARLRFSGKKRFFGVLREHVFHVLWWDPEHTVYPSKKKNT